MTVVSSLANTLTANAHAYCDKSDTFRDDQEFPLRRIGHPNSSEATKAAFRWYPAGRSRLARQRLHAALQSQRSTSQKMMRYLALPVAIVLFNVRFAGLIQEHTIRPQIWDSRGDFDRGGFDFRVLENLLPGLRTVDRIHFACSILNWITSIDVKKKKGLDYIPALDERNGSKLGATSAAGMCGSASPSAATHISPLPVRHQSRWHLQVRQVVKGMSCPVQCRTL
ncbi:hypothetical protein ACJZ2D_014340 [Fusarium nematophilum]